MASFSSMQYTIGTALERARESMHDVEVLVDGHWVAGLVVALDGQGVVLDNNGQDHCIVRLERVAAVRVAAQAPSLRSVPACLDEEDRRGFEGAMPMPGPRVAAY
jgi:hypothetical protein